MKKIWDFFCSYIIAFLAFLFINLFLYGGGFLLNDFTDNSSCELELSMMIDDFDFRYWILSSLGMALVGTIAGYALLAKLNNSGWFGRFLNNRIVHWFCLVVFVFYGWFNIFRAIYNYAFVYDLCH